ncbi:MAG: hypothetical protein J7L26_12720, partial [Candidatus Aminicenantes bacterium]|nr:hypothetical protein [Candidatus Aminicenantes bacterium]
IGINLMPSNIKEKVSNCNTINVSDHKDSNSSFNFSLNIYRQYIDKIIQKWNTFAEKNDLPSIRKLTDKRKEKLKKRLKEGFDIVEICKAIEEQPFLLGENPHQWHVTFDWLIENSTNFLKVIERSYQRKKKKINFDMSWAIRKQKELEEKHGKSN